MFFLSNLCFLCLETYKKPKPVLIENSDEMLVDKKLKYCLPEMDVEFHCKITKYICSNCRSKLEYLYKFKQTCLRNNTYLKSYLQTLTSTGESYKHLSVKLQPVSNDQTLATVTSDDELRTREDEVEKRENSDGNKSHSLFEEKDDVVVKEEFLSSEDEVDDEFYHELVKSIKCDLISSDFDDSVSRIEDIVHEDTKYCNTDSDSENSLTKPNKQNIHTGIKNYECSICKKKFTRKNNLSRHKEIHTGIKNHECLICKKKFMRKNHLTEHEQIHTGIKNYECSTCKKKFMRKSKLIDHETIHTGIRKYECSICKRKFTQKFNLFRHKKFHTGIKNYECSTCKKQFIEKSDLIRHEVIHTGIKNYECSICNEKFMRKSHLIDHETVHTKIKKYECSICKKKYVRKSYLIQHETIHTRI